MKPFWGYNNREEAEKYWPSEVLDSGIITTKMIDVVDDPTKWPQTSSKQVTITRVEHPDKIISF